MAIKIEDGATRASECALAEVLVQLGMLDPEHPAVVARRTPPILSRRGIETGIIQPAMT